MKAFVIQFKFCKVYNAKEGLKNKTKERIL